MSDRQSGDAARTPSLPLLVRLAKLLLPRGYGVVKEVGWEDIRV